MQFRIFTVPLADGRRQEEELNAFVRSHKIVAVERHFAEQTSAWTFCVSYAEEAASPSGFAAKKEKIDYKEVLDEHTFARFAKLREARKQIAAEEAVPAYAVLTNEELAELAAIDNLTEGCFVSVKGIGEKKAEKYEKRMLDLYKRL